jgi:hypothetical protein
VVIEKARLFVADTLVMLTEHEFDGGEPVTKPLGFLDASKPLFELVLVIASEVQQN